jgi:diaminohydroxyphosphoribosylaminopyrimidine deaminase/5-amino-6-(5-phosphoribosylamino)uracil reductase
MRGDISYLKRAIDLSKSAPGGKNFRVGAIVVKDNLIIAEGYSWELGQKTHAEENAYSKVREKGLEGATLYCSMAPCTSRSSGNECCLDRSLRVGIKRVVYACIAPDEDISKLKFDKLELVQIKELEKIAQEVNSHWNW